MILFSRNFVLTLIAKTMNLSLHGSVHYNAHNASVRVKGAFFSFGFYGSEAGRLRLILGIKKPAKPDKRLV